MRQAKELLRDSRRAAQNPNGQIDSSGSPVSAGFSHERWKLEELLRCRGGLSSAANRGGGVENGTRYDCRNAPT